MFSGDYTPGRKCEAPVKDLKNVMTACREYDVAMPLTESVLAMMECRSGTGVGYEPAAWQNALKS